MKSLVHRTALSVLGMVVALALPSSAATITSTLTFDSLPTGEMLAGSSYVEGIYIITAVTTSGGQALVTDIGGAHQNEIRDSSSGDTAGTGFRITRVDGGLFSVSSIDVRNFNPSPDSTVVTCSSGTGGHVKLSSEEGDCVIFGPGLTTYNTFSVSGFNDISLLSVSIVSRNILDREYAVDNLKLTAQTPEPSTVMTSLAGFAFLVAGIRRRRA